MGSKKGPRKPWRGRDQRVEEAPLKPRTAYDDQPFIGVVQTLALIAALSGETLTVETVCGDLHWLTSIRNQVEALIVKRIGQLDELLHADDAPTVRGTPGDPELSCRHLLHRNLQVTGDAVEAQIRTARALRELTPTRKAFERGAISLQHVSVIRRAVEEVRSLGWTGDLQDSLEARLVEAAWEVDPAQLLQFYKQIRYEQDQEAGVAAEHQQRERRWLNMRQLRDGNYRIEGELDHASGTTVKTALKSLMPPPAKDDERTTTQRRADALTELCRRQLDWGKLPERGGQKPHLLLTATLETLRLEPGSPLAKLDWGVDITGESARRIGCDAQVTPVLVGREGDILHVGSASRTVSPRTRKALNLRDQHCQWEDCTIPAPDCVPHHVDHWAVTRWTSLDKLRLYCDRHHRLLHPENDRYRSRMKGDRHPP